MTKTAMDVAWVNIFFCEAVVILTVIRRYDFAFRFVLVEPRFLVVIALLTLGNCATARRIAIQSRLVSGARPIRLQLFLESFHQLRLLVVIQLALIACPLIPEDNALNLPHGFIAFPNTGDQVTRIVRFEILTFNDAFDCRSAFGEFFDCRL